MNSTKFVDNESDNILTIQMSAIELPWAPITNPLFELAYPHKT